MKYTIELYVTRQDKEYWEIDVPDDTNVEALYKKLSEDPYLISYELEGDMVDSDHIETLFQEFGSMYETGSIEIILPKTDLEDDVSP
jgi:hypothetical protein